MEETEDLNSAYSKYPASFKDIVHLTSIALMDQTNQNSNGKFTTLFYSVNKHPA